MLCDRVLGNVAGDALDWPTHDLVDVPWNECGKRALRKQSHGGRDVKILLPLGVRLRHGDVLGTAAQGSVVVNVPPCEVLVGRPVGAGQMGMLALELGNLHTPAQVAGGEIVVLPDGPIEALFDRYGTPYERQTRRFAPLPVEVAPHLRFAQDFRILQTG